MGPREVEIAQKLIRTAARWRGCGIPVRAWPRYLRDAERVSKAYIGGECDNPICGGLNKDGTCPNGYGETCLGYRDRIVGAQ